MLSSRAIMVDGDAAYMTCVVDITDRKETELRLQRLAMSDPLTGLANRAHFVAAVTQATASSGDRGLVAILLLDLDEFKRINDTAGHDAGDALLQTVAERLRGALRPGDLIARMGGDEFAVLLTRLPEVHFWSIEQVSSIVGQSAVSMIIGIVGSVILLRALPKVGAFRDLILAGSTAGSEGYVSAPTDHDVELLGKEGVTVTELRPVGVGVFDGRRLDIIAEGEFIEEQTAVKVISARGARVVVQPA